MNSRESVDYFLVVEDGDVAHVHANGNGIELVAAMARMSLVASLPSIRSGRQAASFAEFNARRAGSGASYYDYLNLQETNDLLFDPHSIVSPEHQKRLGEQVKAGVRSPQDVIDQMTQETKDQDMLWRKSQYRWFDGKGRRVTVPSRRGRDYSRSAGDKNDENLALRWIQRTSSVDTIRAETKQTLYSIVPAKRKVRSNKVVPYLDTRDLSEKAFNNGTLLEHTTFGYLEDEHFFPVVTDLAPDHPVVIQHTKNQE